MCWNWFPAESRARRLRPLLGLPALLLTLAAWAQTNVSGSARDAITGQPLAGVQVIVARAATTLATGVTGNDGIFQLFVDVPSQPQPQTLSLSTAKAGYGIASQQVIVSAGRANLLSYRFSLLRDEAQDCASTWARTVVVGHVRPPVSAAGDLALSQRIGEVLQYDLLTEVQKTHLPPEQQPVVLPCPKALPRNLVEHGDWARALKADAFLVGSAEPVDRKFRVDLQVTSPYFDSPLPLPASTQLLNLDRPESADLGRAALTPILQALLMAYLKDKRYAECVEFAAAAQRAVGTKPELSRLYQDCRAQLPNQGLLLTGGGP